MKFSGYILLLVSAATFSAALNADTVGKAEKAVEKQWLDRAGESLKILEKLIAKNGDSKGKNLSKDESCQWKLESNFSLFISSYSSFSKENPKSLMLEDHPEEKARVYRIPIFEDKDIKAHINCVYKYGSTQPDTLNVMNLTKGVSVAAMAKNPGFITIRTEKCIYVIKVADPLQASAISNE